MAGMETPASTVVERVIGAPTDAVYRALTDPRALATWLPPDDMAGIVHAFDGREGGRFSMSLIYPTGEAGPRGKSSDDADRFEARIVTLVPGELVVWAVLFQSADPSFAGEMTVSTRLTPSGTGTRVAIRCDDIPPGIRPEDNEAGCRSSLEKLATYLGA